MKKIAITGGIGSGKSTVTEVFSELGVKTVNADKVVHTILDSNQKLQKEILDFFGVDCWDSKQNRVNRQILGEIIFEDDQKRRWLEEKIHPLVFEAFDLMTETAQEENIPFFIFDIPLLFETGYEKKMDGVIVVWSTFEQQLERVQKRSGLTVEAVQKRISHQIPLEEKVKKGDWIIDNSKTVEQTIEQTKSIFNLLTTSLSPPQGTKIR